MTYIYKNKYKKKFIININLFIAIFVSFTLNLNAQLIVNTGMTPTQLVQNILVGSGVTVSNVTFSGASNSIGSFTTGTSPTNLGLTSGIIMSSGDVSYAPGPVSGFASTVNSTGSDPQLASLISSSSIYDAAVLQFNFIPQSDTIKFRYVFASEEYLEWVGSSYNDVFGFFISGPNPQGGSYNFKNIALIPNTSLPVAINNVHSGSYSMYYVNNEGMYGQTIVYDGFTTVLTAWALVTPCVQYSIKIAIGDAGDSSYDSAVFLEENSFSSTGIAINTYYAMPSLGLNAIEGCSDATISFVLSKPSTTNFPIIYTISGTATNGVDYTQIPTTLVIPPGQDSASITITPIMDGILEGFETVMLIVQTSVCGTDTVIVNIYDNTPLTVTSSPDAVICGDPTTISVNPNGGLTPYTYNWSNGAGTTQSVTVNPSISTTYTVTVNDACGQSATEQVIVSYGTGSSSVSPDTAICLGGTATLSATGGTGYLWDNGATSSAISVSPTIETTYWVTIYGVCDGAAPVVVSVMPAPTPTASVDPGEICVGEMANLTATGGLTYTWSASPGDGSLGGQANTPSPMVSPQTTTTYTVIAADANSCTNTADVVLIVSPSPNANFIANPPVASSFDPEINFIDNSSNSPIVWLWNLGDGTQETTPSFTHTYPGEGQYLVSLWVQNSYGCSDSTTALVYVQPDYSFWVPNAFTPNNDDINDYFYVYFVGISHKEGDYHLMLFDRWGQLVFETENPYEGWDGKINGINAQEGVYSYKIKFRDGTNIKRMKYGRVTLYR